MKWKGLCILFLILILPFHFIEAQDENIIQDTDYKFNPSIGGQTEFTFLYYMYELGALIDIDLFKKQSKSIHSFGVRISFENYDAGGPGGSTFGGPYQDYCFYIAHSAKSKTIHFNLLAGFVYHTREPVLASPNRILFRTGAELRFNLLSKIIGVVIKGSTSFRQGTGFAGLGIAIGYYE